MGNVYIASTHAKKTRASFSARAHGRGSGREHALFSRTRAWTLRFLKREFPDANVCIGDTIHDIIDDVRELSGTPRGVWHGKRIDDLSDVKNAAQALKASMARDGKTPLSFAAVMIERYPHRDGPVNMLYVHMC